MRCVGAAPRRSGGYILGLGLLLAAAAPVGAGGQVTAVSPLANVDLEETAYDEAKREYELATRKADRLRNEWNRLLAQHAVASRAGNQDRVNELLAEFEQRSGPKNRAENAWRTGQEEWIAAGKALISAIDSYLDILWESMERSVGATDDEFMYTGQFEELEEKLRAVEEELPEEPLELEPMPEVTIRSEDTPREIEFKARLIENRVAFYENLLDELDRDIATLTKRQRREQSRRDSRRARDRFGEGTAPIGDQRLIRTDAAAAAREPIEVRIEAKQALREEVEKRMEELKQKARDFRQQRAGGTP